MAQYARPDSDVALGGWTDPSWSVIDEVTPDDGDYTQKTGSGTLQAGLSDITDPAIGTGHIIRFRANQSSGGGGPESLNCELYQGATLVAASGAQKLTRGSFVTFEYTLTESEANAITNYADLRLHFTPTQGSAEIVRLSWAEFEVPNATETHSGTTTVSGNGTVIGEVKKGGIGAAIKSGGGTLLAIGVAAMLGVASIFGGGVQVTVGQKAALSSASVSGNGSVIAIGTQGGETYSGTAAISGNGAVLSDGKKNTQDSTLVSGNGLVVNEGKKLASSPVLIPGSGSLVVSTFKTGQRIIVVSESGVLTGVGEKQIFDETIIAGGGSVTAIGSTAESYSNSAIISGGGNVITMGQAAVNTGILIKRIPTIPTMRSKLKIVRCFL